MAHPDAVAHLIEAMATGQLPPQGIPSGAPLALWVLVHQPQHFHEVYFHHEVTGRDPWHTARAPEGLFLGRLKIRRIWLAAALRKFFRSREGIGRFCKVASYRMRGSCCFVAHVANRPQVFDTFSNHGWLVRRSLWLALPVVFVYFPEDGTVLLRSHVRSRERTGELFHLFGTAALGKPVTFGTPIYNLEILKNPFDPLPDASDMEAVHVRALHLRYPDRSGKRMLKLHTLANDHATAIHDLLKSHVDRADLAHLRVTHAELQVRLRLDARRKNYAIQLWPNRCTLPQSPLGDRFRACLRRWGLCYAG
jgi:hypothetical protein